VLWAQLRARSWRWGGKERDGGGECRRSGGGGKGKECWRRVYLRRRRLAGIGSCHSRRSSRSAAREERDPGWSGGHTHESQRGRGWGQRWVGSPKREQDNARVVVMMV
jgi:hypothetical protein